MRRIEKTAFRFAAGCIVSAKRHARRRHAQRDIPEEPVVSDSIPESWKGMIGDDTQVDPDISSLRSSGASTTPASTSLDKIRSQLAAMQNENRLTVEAAKQAAEQRRWEELMKEQQEQDTLRAGLDSTPQKSRDDALTKMICGEYARLNKPNEAFRIGKEVMDGVAQRSHLQQRRRFNDADEVLRKTKNGVDTQRYMKLAFPKPSEQTARLVDVVRNMQTTWSAEREKLLPACSPSHGPADGGDGNGDVDSAAATQLAWLTVLEGLSDEDVRTLWEAEVLDTETISALLSSSGPATAARAEDDNAPAAAATGDSDAAYLRLNEKIRLIQQLHYLQEITNTIRETELGDVPPIDLAPTIVKAQRREYDNVAAEELRLLERYEESPVMHVHLKAATDAQGKVETATDSVGVPAALLDRILIPSNSFLNAVAQTDAPLRRSMEQLERIKRETLLDPSFQEAVRFAHTVEEASVAPHLRGGGDAGLVAGADDARAPSQTARRSVSKRERRAARAKEVRGPMARSPYSPEVVPYFYNDVRSIVPPRGAFNLPNPTPTKAERAALRGRRRRMRNGARYAK
ncbi:hypothetical protein NESM_000385500 [Novymonas esmeraldas]|uniref:Uncharacterized protein n=1 Tax=Novymonas esmeraldas TaxID=1808958 RepID=A0AAW0EN95_9TRYP